MLLSKHNHFTELGIDLPNTEAFALGFGKQKDKLCIGNNGGPRPFHRCNKWFEWKGRHIYTNDFFV